MFWKKAAYRTPYAQLLENMTSRKHYGYEGRYEEGSKFAQFEILKQRILG